MANIAERQLRDVSYFGEKPNWTFKKVVTVHKEQYHVLISLEKHAYKGIDERSKVRHLIDGVKTAKLDTIKATILSFSEYRNSFDRCVTLHKDFGASDESQPKGHNYHSTNPHQNQDQNNLLTCLLACVCVCVFTYAWCVRVNFFIGCKWVLWDQFY